MTQEELNAIRKRTEAATPGPWAWDEPFDNWITQEGLGYLEIRDEDDKVIAILKIDDSQNADFIAHAREDIPTLLNENERLRELGHKCLHALLSAGDALNWPDDVEDAIAELRKTLGR